MRCEGRDDLAFDVGGGAFGTTPCCWECRGRLVSQLRAAVPEAEFATMHRDVQWQRIIRYSAKFRGVEPESIPGFRPMAEVRAEVDGDGADESEEDQEDDDAAKSPAGDEERGEMASGGGKWPAGTWERHALPKPRARSKLFWDARILAVREAEARDDRFAADALRKAEYALDEGRRELLQSTRRDAISTTAGRHFMAEQKGRITY
jgi:hypothetical protein